MENNENNQSPLEGDAAKNGEALSDREGTKGDGATGEVRVRVPFKEKLENYWYHYKWHTIAVLFVLLVTVVMIVNCAGREKYDVYILYAGDKAVSTSKSNPERQQFLNAFNSVTSDFDGNGEVNAAFKHLYQPDDEEIARIKELEKKGQAELPESLIYEDGKTLDSLLMQSEYYLLFLDKAVFDRCCERGIISSVEGFLPEGYKGEIVKSESGGSGIWLKDLGFYQLEGINTLPDDVVICIKLAGAMSSDGDLELREDAIAVFRMIALT